MTSEHREIAPHITTSPEGKPCIGMRSEGQDWILLTAKRSPLADDLADELTARFDLRTKLDQPFDWRVSLERNELVGGDEAPVGVKGIYVHAEQFDRFLDENLLTGL